MNPYSMIPFDDAVRTILDNVEILETEEVEFDAALGRVVAEDITSTVQMPPFRAAGMDGFAVIAADDTEWREIIGEQAAGYDTGVRVTPGTAVRIMTGAPVPEGADAVEMVEKTEERDGKVRLTKRIQAEANLRRAGEDLDFDELVIERGAVITPAEIGILATIGRTSLRVFRRPVVAVMSTGDELVEPHEAPGAGQIRDSNRYTLLAAVRIAGAIPLSLGIGADDPQELAARFERGLEQADVLLTSGGVSMGDKDFVHEQIKARGELHFGKVAQKPGKPAMFATVAVAGRRRYIFGLPGYPVSSLVTFENLVRPALRKMMGFTALHRPVVQVTLTHDVRHKPDRVEFVRAVVWREGEGYKARTTGAQRSGRLTSMLGANALLQLPAGVTNPTEGDKVLARLIDQPEV